MPERTCLGCRKVRNKAALVRLALTGEGVPAPDPAGRLPGRGAYLCPDRGCVEAALRNKGAFSRAFRRRIEPPDADELRAGIVGAGPQE